MYSIAVCDDEKTAMQYIVHDVRANFEKLNQPVLVDGYTDPQDLETRLKQGTTYDALLLDIDMPGLNGIELCRHFRQQDGDALIVFVSNREELVFQTFEVSPFRFIRKSHFSAEIEKLCLDMNTELGRRAERYLCIKDEPGNTVVSVSINKLYYVEASRKVCLLHTKDGVIEIKAAFKDIKSELDAFDFLWPHRSYLVNPHFIFRLDNTDVVLDNGEKIPLSRNRVTEVKSEFFRWRRAGL